MSTTETTPLLPPAAPISPPPKSWKRSGIITISAIIFAGLIAVTLFKFGPSHVSMAKETKIENVFRHLENLYDLTKDFPRRSRSVVNGYNASAEYIYSQLLQHTDYEIQVHHFPIQLFIDVKPPTLSVTFGSESKTFTAGPDFGTLSDSGTSQIKNSKLDLIRGGCDIGDYKSAEGVVVLINREAGKCSYRVKIAKAVESKVSGVILFSSVTPGEPILGRCVGCFNSSVVGFGASQSLGLELLELLASNENVSVSLSASTGYKEVITSNVLATTPNGRDDKIIVAGSHLDSVPQGPGMNDDGSGASTTLEIALTLYRTGLSKKVVNKIRFAFWAAEELGLLGSFAYVRDLAKNHPEELKKIVLNLNDDMLASPNFARLVYNGRAAEPPIDPKLNGPSGVIQDVFEGWLDYKGLAHETTPFDGRSDYGGFLEYGIPAGGLFTGAEVLKTPEQVLKFGGIAGVAYDPCYHQACDDLTNVSGPGKVVLGELASTLAYAIQRFGFEADIEALLAGKKPIGNPKSWD